MMNCPFYFLFCRRRKKKCIGYFEGWTDAQAMVAADILLKGLDKFDITEEGAKMFEAIHNWDGEENHEETS